ncbi:MAG TPA: hypothetical protein VFY93_08855 [Planctomycetota bacterium]|nr:hypothetical protein [Planctomycetota bacterium]
MKYAWILALGLVVACGKEEAPAQKTMPTVPGTRVETPKAETPPLTVPDADAAKAALDKSIADTKALLEKKQADAKALLDKAKTDPMNAASYKTEADKLQKEIADLQAKLDGYMREAAAK